MKTGSLGRTPLCMTGVLIRRADGDTGTEGDPVRTQGKEDIYTPRRVASGEPTSAHTPTSDSEPPEPRENEFLWLEPPACGPLLWQPQLGFGHHSEPDHVCLDGQGHENLGNQSNVNGSFSFTLVFTCFAKCFCLVVSTSFFY